MFFQTPTPPTPPSGGGGLSDSQFERLQNSITRAVESGFKNAKFDKTSTTGTKSDDGYFGRRSYGGGDQSTQQEIEEDILSPGRMLKNAQSKILGPLYAAGKDLSLEMSRAINSLQQDATNVFVQFGKGREASAGISKSLGEAKFSIMEMGGGADDAFKTLTELYDTTNKTSLTSAQYVDDLYASAEVTGVRVGELAGKFETVGNSIRSVSSTMMDVVDYAASVGLNVQAVSKQVVQNFEKLNTYNFEGGVKGLTRMAAQATMLKMDMSRTLALADDLLSPEKAMEMAAGLQRLGVSTSALIDPLRLMDMAQNDPEQLQKEIVNLTKQYTYFNEETKKTEILPGAQRYLRELAPILGLSTQELANMAVQSGTIERKLSEIRMPNVVQTEEDKMLFANLAELNKEGKYEIKYYDENAQEQKVLLENMTETQRDAIKASQKIMDDPKEIAKRQLTAAEQTNMLLESLGARLPRELAETKTAYELSELTTTISRTTARGTYDAGRETLGISTEDLKGYDKELIEFLDAAKTSIEEDSENIGNVISGLEGKIEGFFNRVSNNTKDFVNESGEMDLNKMTEKIGNVFKNVGTEVAGNFSNSFKKAIDIELKGASSIFAESLLKGTKKVLDKFPEGSTSQGESTTNVGSPTPQETGSESDEFPDEPENITNTQNNLNGKDIIVNNNNNISLLEKDNVAIGRDGMMAGTDLMGLKERFGDMSLDLSKGFSSSIDEFKTSFRSLLENWSPTETLGQTQTSIEPKLLSDNLNITLNPELAPEFAKIYKEVRDMGKLIPLSFSFELPDFNFDFKTDKNMDSYEEFKKSLENQIIKPNIPTEDHKLKFTADKVEGLDQVNEKIGEVKSTKIEIPLEITDKSKDEPITRKVEASLDETNVSTMVKDLFSEKRMNIGFEFKNREEFEKLSNEFDELTKEKKINVTQEEFKSEIPTEQTLNIKLKQDEFVSNVPEEQISHLKLDYNKENTNSLYDQISEKFGDPFKLTFEQEKFESTIPSEQILKIKPVEENFETKIPEEQSFKLNYEFSNKSDFDKTIEELYKTKDPYNIKFISEKFETDIPESKTIKINTEQEKFESNIPQEQSFKLNYDFINKTDFDKVLEGLDKTKDVHKLKFEQEKFESNIPQSETIKVKTEQEKFESTIPKEQTSHIKFNYDKDKTNTLFDEVNEKFGTPLELKFNEEKLKPILPEETELKFKYNFVNQDETQTLIEKMSSDNEFKLFADNESLIKANENVGSIFDKDFKVTPKLDETPLLNTKLPDMEQNVLINKPSDTEITSLKEQFEEKFEPLKANFQLPQSMIDQSNLTGLNENQSTTSRFIDRTRLFGNENNNITQQSTTDVLMKMLMDRSTSPNMTEIPIAQPITPIMNEIPSTNNLPMATANAKMEFGELKIVHEIKVNSGNVDPAVVGQAFTQLTRDPSFVKTLESRIKDIQGGMGQQVQMNPMSA